MANYKVDYDQVAFPRNIEKLKREIAIGYENARKNRPELPPSYTLREHINRSARTGRILRQQKDKDVASDTE